MKAVVAAFNQEKALVGAFSVITNLRMELVEALLATNISSGQINIIRLILTWSDLLEGMGELPPSEGMSTIPWMWSFVSCSFLLASLTSRIRIDGKLGNTHK